MKKSVSPAAIGILTFAISMVPASGGEVLYLGRAGLFDQSGGLEFTRNDNFQHSEGVITEGGWLIGSSKRFGGGSDSLGEAVWVAKASDGSTIRVGLFSGPDFTNRNNYQHSAVTDYTGSGWLSGTSVTSIGDLDSLDRGGQAAWVAKASDGSTTRLGFFSGSEFTSYYDRQYSTVTQLTETGWLSGLSELYIGDYSPGKAAWVAKASDGSTTRLGFFSGSEFTSYYGTQSSQVSHLTESGWLSGSSERFNSEEMGNPELGHAAWVAKASDGSTTRIGFFSGPEFTASDGRQFSEVHELTESGWLSGYSRSYNGNDSLAIATWVAKASDGSTTRIGLFTGSEFTANNGNQFSRVSELTDSGWLSGFSERHNGGSLELGFAAWVANASDGSTTRTGLFTGSEFTGNDGTQSSSVFHLTESGWLFGNSHRYNGGSTYLGSAAWVANASDGSAIRIGFFSGAEFTGNDGFQSSDVQQLTESGWLSGYSERYIGGDIGGVAWVANASDGSTTRVGLFSGTEFSKNDGNQSSAIFQLTESGWLSGHSTRYNGGSSHLGTAAWLAKASDGSTARVGLFSGSEFTRNDGRQYSEVSQLTESGWLSGHSARYNGGSTELGQAAWVAEAEDGSTTRVGLFGSTVYTALDGTEYSFGGTGFTDQGLAWGISRRYNGDNTQDGEAAWIYNLTTGTQIAIELSIRPSDGYAFSEILGITPLGLAYGRYTLFSGETNLGDRAFLWSTSLGIVALNDAISGGVAQFGWENFRGAESANGSGIITGFGLPLGDPAFSRGIFIVQVPEPTAAAYLLLGINLLALHRRRSAQG